MYNYNNNVLNIRLDYLIPEKGPKMTNEEYLLFRSLIYNKDKINDMNIQYLMEGVRYKIVNGRVQFSWFMK